MDRNKEAPNIEWTEFALPDIDLSEFYASIMFKEPEQNNIKESGKPFDEFMGCNNG